MKIITILKRIPNTDLQLSPWFWWLFMKCRSSLFAIRKYFFFPWWWKWWSCSRSCGVRSLWSGFDQSEKWSLQVLWFSNVLLWAWPSGRRHWEAHLKGVKCIHQLAWECPLTPKEQLGRIIHINLGLLCLACWHSLMWISGLKMWWMVGRISVGQNIFNAKQRCPSNRLVQERTLNVKHKSEWPESLKKYVNSVIKRVHILMFFSAAFAA